MASFMGDDSEDEWYVDGYKVSYATDLDDEFADARQIEERWACSAVVMHSDEVEVVGKPAVVFGPGGVLGVRVLKGGRNEPIDASHVSDFSGHGFDSGGT